MQQKLILKTEMAQTIQTAVPKLSFNVPDIDALFPAFKGGDFAVIYGPQMVTSLIGALCNRAQLGSLDGKVVFIDAASSSLKEALGNVTYLRAYTAYRLTSLIMEKIEEAVENSDAKLVVISDLACPFLNDAVDDQEAKAIYSQITSYLASFAKKHRVIVVATHLSHEDSRRNQTLREITTAKANTVLRFSKTPYTSEVELEKHPTYMLGVMELDAKAEADFASANSAQNLKYRIL